MSRRPATLVVMTLVVLVCIASTAFANGIDLPTREARQGEQIAVTGHAWLTCCPPSTPVEHVQLFLVKGSALEESQRVLLFDVAANEEGTISTAFTVPYVAPGRYRLEACGGLTPETAPCLPEGGFTVHVGLSPSSAASPAPDDEDPGWLLPVLAVLVVGGASALAYLFRSRSPTSI